MEDERPQTGRGQGHVTRLLEMDRFSYNYSYTYREL